MLRAIIVFMFLFSMPLGLLYANGITLTQTITASIEGNSLLLKLSIANEGQMPALNVTPKVVVGESKKYFSVIDELKAGHTFSQAIRLDLSDRIQGEYHVLVLTAYQDSKGFRYANDSQMYLNTVLIDEHPVGLSSIIVSSDSTEKRVIVVIKNHGGEELLVKLEFVIPDGVATNRLREEFTLSQKTEKEFTIILNASNFERYNNLSIYAIAVYSINDIRHSQIISVSTNLIKQKSVIERFFSSQYLMFVLSGLLVLILAYNIFINMRRR